MCIFSLSLKMKGRTYKQTLYMVPFARLLLLISYACLPLHLAHACMACHAAPAFACRCIFILLMFQILPPWEWAFHSIQWHSGPGDRLTVQIIAAGTCLTLLPAPSLFLPAPHGDQTRPCFWTGTFIVFYTFYKNKLLLWLKVW